jgi:hypothetical protein
VTRAVAIAAAAMEAEKKVVVAPPRCGAKVREAWTNRCLCFCRRAQGTTFEEGYHDWLERAAGERGCWIEQHVS